MEEDHQHLLMLSSIITNKCDNYQCYCWGNLSYDFEESYITKKNNRDNIFVQLQDVDREHLAMIVKKLVKAVQIIFVNRKTENARKVDVKKGIKGKSVKSEVFNKKRKYRSQYDR